MTPEGKIKQQVKELLAEFDIRHAKEAGTFEKSAGWYFMPGQNGFGVKGIPDFVGHFHSQFFSVETKAPGKAPTGFQELQINAIRNSGGPAFVVSNDEEFLILTRWLHQVKNKQEGLRG